MKKMMKTRVMPILLLGSFVNSLLAQCYVASPGSPCAVEDRIQCTTTNSTDNDCIQWHYEPKTSTYCNWVDAGYAGCKGKTDCTVVNAPLTKYTRDAECDGSDGGLGCNWDNFNFVATPAGTCSKAVLSGSSCGVCPG